MLAFWSPKTDHRQVPKSPKFGWLDHTPPKLNRAVKVSSAEGATSDLSLDAGMRTRDRWIESGIARWHTPGLL